MTVEIEAATEDETTLWHALMDLDERATDWTLIGARMVGLHALEFGRPTLRTSLDADVLADARARPNAVRRVSQILVGEQFVLEEPSYMGVGHVFAKGGVQIDVLAPEHLGGGSEAARTTVRGARTVEVPGGRQALGRTERVGVHVSGRAGELPRPNLLGAILIKTRAVDVDDAPENQRADLALLLSLVDDPEALRHDFRGDERQWLARRREMDEPGALAWRGLDAASAQAGLAALRVLAGWRV